MTDMYTICRRIETSKLRCQTRTANQYRTPESPPPSEKTTISGCETVTPIQPAKIQLPTATEPSRYSHCATVKRPQSTHK